MGFSASRVNRVVRGLLSGTRRATQQRWLAAVHARVARQRPDLAVVFARELGCPAASEGLLDELSIGEVGSCYEALLALSDRESRKDSGQFFTPDDTAYFMARQSLSFPEGRWIDPACGVGNLAWHLASVQADPARFVAESLSLVDKDAVALKTAQALIAADFIAEGDVDGCEAFYSRTRCANFLSSRKIPDFDFAIVNPPYARAPLQRGYSTKATRDYFAFFLERIARQASGMIAVTPASYLSVPKYQVLRDVIDGAFRGGRVFVFDNVPDTLFRGYKFGSTNTSTTNFVRSAITVCDPGAEQWRVTPILRWQTAKREYLWREAPALLAPRLIGPFGEWVKALPGTESLFERLLHAPRTLRDLVIQGEETPFRLDVGMTPRYYISAAFRSLDRASKATLYFPDEASRDLAALVLNSSIPYLWWRMLDGGVTFPRRLLMSTPIPADLEVDAELLRRLREREEDALVVKMNAGRPNENVKHCRALVAEVDAHVVPELRQWQRELLYARSMFPLPRSAREALQIAE